MATGKDTKKAGLTPQAAKILEQYRNAGKGIPAAGTDGTGAPGDGTGGAPAKPAGPPPALQMRRSGTRGK